MSKYNIGDKVWIMYNNYPTEFEITSITNKKIEKTNIATYKKEEYYELSYGLGYTRYVPKHGLYFYGSTIEYVSDHYLREDQIFETKELLIKSL